MLNIKKSSIIPIFIITIIAMLLVFVKGCNPVFLLTVALIMVSFFVLKNNPYDNFAIMFFLITFFFFLMSSEFVQEVFGVINRRAITAEANHHSMIVLLLGVIFLLVGYSLKVKQIFNKRIHSKSDINIIRKASSIIMYTTFGAYLAVTIDMFIYIAQTSYLNYYLNYSSRIPSIIVQIGDIAPIAFAVYLATFPSKKECKIPFIIYLINGIISLFSGKRYVGMSVVLFIIAYCLIRNVKDKETWISKKMIIIIITLVPVACLGLYITSFIRLGNRFTSNSLFTSLLSFFNSAGESNKVIKYGYMYKDSIPKGHIYSFGGIIDYFKYNQITKLFTGSTLTRSQSANYALNGNNFSALISYLVMPQKYLAGQGLGSSYLAELYQDMGYVGVICGSFFYGIMFRNLFQISGNVWHDGICFYIFTTMLKAPRDTFDCFFQEIINIKFIIFIVGIIVVYQSLKKRLQC